MERVCVCIDGSNLYHHLKEVFHRANLDFARFVQWLVGKRQLVRTYYYNAAISAAREPQKAKDQQRFFGALDHIPYFETRLGRLEPRGDVFVEKGVDVRLATDILSMAFRGVYDTAIIVSCDGDFAHALDAVRDMGKHVEVACFQRAYHIKRAADKVIELDDTSLKPFMRTKK